MYFTTNNYIVFVRFCNEFKWQMQTLTMVSFYVISNIEQIDVKNVK